MSWQEKIVKEKEAMARWPETAEKLAFESKLLRSLIQNLVLEIQELNTSFQKKRVPPFERKVQIIKIVLGVIGVLILIYIAFLK